jgi:hypothetical protein
MLRATQTKIRRGTDSQAKRSAASLPRPNGSLFANKVPNDNDDM